MQNVHDISTQVWLDTVFVVLVMVVFVVVVVFFSFVFCFTAVRYLMAQLCSTQNHVLLLFLFFTRGMKLNGWREGRRDIVLLSELRFEPTSSQSRVHSVTLPPTVSKRIKKKSVLLVEATMEERACGRPC